MGTLVNGVAYSSKGSYSCILGAFSPTLGVLRTPPPGGPLMGQGGGGAMLKYTPQARCIKSQQWHSWSVRVPVHMLCFWGPSRGELPWRRPPFPCGAPPCRRGLGHYSELRGGANASNARMVQEASLPQTTDFMHLNTQVLHRTHRHESDNPPPKSIAQKLMDPTPPIAWRALLGHQAGMENGGMPTTSLDTS